MVEKIVRIGWRGTERHFLTSSQDWAGETPEMLKIARQRAAKLEQTVHLREADAHDLPFGDERFDTVVCTYSLCNIPDPALAVSEMRRVLRRGGSLILVDHIRSTSAPVLWFQKLIEFFSKRLEGGHMTRRPAEQVENSGLEIVERQRLGPRGVVERVVASKSP